VDPGFVRFPPHGAHQVAAGGQGSMTDRAAARRGAAVAVGAFQQVDQVLSSLGSAESVRFHLFARSQRAAAERAVARFTLGLEAVFPPPADRQDRQEYPQQTGQGDNDRYFYRQVPCLISVCCPGRPGSACRGCRVPAFPRISSRSSPLLSAQRSWAATAFGCFSSFCPLLSLG
jgi:hypothetical protein